MMNKGYKLIKCSIRSDLSKEVRKSLREGWECQGGIAVFMEAQGILGVEPCYCQAMRKDK